MTLPSETNLYHSGLDMSIRGVCAGANRQIFRVAAMHELEEELLHPTGITTVHRPPLKLDVAFISPECGIFIEGKDADGMRSRIFFRKVTSCTWSL